MTNSFTWNPADFFTLYGKNPIPEGKKSIISVSQFTPKMDQHKNLDSIRKISKKIMSGEKAEFIVFPELSITGHIKPEKRAETINASNINCFIEIAMELRVYLIAGFAEQEGQKLFNTAIIAGPEGLIGTYRKTHLSNADEKWASKYPMVIKSWQSNWEHLSHYFQNLSS